MTVSPDELLAFSKKHLAVYKALNVVYLTQDFPRTKNGKILGREVNPDITTLGPGIKPSKKSLFQTGD